MTRALLYHVPPSTIAAALGVGFTLLLYLVAWWFWGRDPSGGAIIPRFEPPDGLAADAVRYLYAMAADRRVFAAGLVDLAVRGAIRIRQDGEIFSIEKAADGTNIPPSEAAIATKLLQSRKTLELSPYNADQIEDAIIAQAWVLHDACDKYFTSNTGWLAGGIGMLVATAIAAIFLTDDPGGTAVDIVFLGSFFAVVSGFAGWVLKRWRNVRRHPGTIVITILASIGALFAVLFLLILAVFGFSAMMPPVTTLILLAGAGMAWAFYYLLKAPSADGIAVFDKIAGFRMFLDASEKDRLEMLNPPDVTPELFDKYLPYAIALNCENRWSKNFEAEAAAAALKRIPYRPGWFTGTALALDALDNIATLGASIGSAAAAAAVALPAVPTHVGFGVGTLAVDGLLAGAGFAGGGRGGGGGGGW
jgi:hypothetical protein